MTTPKTWHIITAEYPPKVGGVGDFTARLAGEMAGAGYDVHVWTTTPNDNVSNNINSNITIHVVSSFAPSGLRSLGKSLKQYPGPRTLLVQYVPHAYGMKGLNLPFAIWMWLRKFIHGDDVRVMFHEIAFPWVRRPLRHNLLAFVNRVMAWLLVKASRVLYVSTPSWEPALRRLGGGGRPIRWLPIMATVAETAAPESIAACRAKLPPGPVVGHFGTYGTISVAMLAPRIEAILHALPEVAVLLIGHRGEDFRRQLVASHPEWSARVVAFGHQSDEQIAAAIGACDVCIQPYDDGASARRTSLLAVLANDVAVVANRGVHSEPFWEAGGIPLTDGDEPSATLKRVRALLGDADLRRAAALAGRALYERCFSTSARLAALTDTA